MFRPAVARWRAVTREAGPTAAAAGAAAMALAAAAASPAACEAGPSSPSFDPEALERGAAALREINKSPNAKQVRRLFESAALWCFFWPMERV